MRKKNRTGEHGLGDAESIEPFKVDVPQRRIDDLNARLDNARWPDQLPGVGWEYGTERSYLQDLCEYWREEFDWNAFEDRLNQFDQYVTTIDGQRVHFYHVKSSEPDAQPLLLSHGWPGSVTEFLDVLGPLTDPASHGGDPEDGFNIVAPSLPGYGFSGTTHERGYDVRKMAETFDTLMDRLDYDNYIAQGGDWGALISTVLGSKFADNVQAIHLNMVFINTSEISADLDKRGMKDYQEIKEFRDNEMGYYEIQETKPQSLAYGLNDSPIGLAGWIIEKFYAWSDCKTNPEESFERDRLLDILSLYWLTETINSSMRLYYENGEIGSNEVDVPVGHTRYPAEIIKTPRVWVEEVYDVIHWEEQQEGGHFAAMEVPELFVQDIRKFGRSI